MHVHRALSTAVMAIAVLAAVVRVNVDEAPQLALRWDVGALPTFLVMKADYVVARRIGAATADELVELVRRMRARAPSRATHAHISVHVDRKRPDEGT
jgi:hypothetical protein